MQKSEGHLTSRGVFLLVLVLFLTVLGVVLSQTELLSGGVMILLILAAALVSVFVNTQGLELKVANPLRVHAGKKFKLTLACSNVKRFFSSREVLVDLHVPHAEALHVPVLRLAAGQQFKVDLAARVSRRTSVLEIQYTLISDFPFGLIQRRVQGVLLLNPTMIVYPQSIVPMELWQLGESHQNPYAGQHAFADASGEIKGVREWRSGDAAKLIHWKSSVRALERGRGLRVREFEPPSKHARHYHVVFHSYGKGVLRQDRFERAIAYVEGVLRHFHGVSIGVTLHADFLGWHPMEVGTREELLEMLAMLAQAQRALDTEGHEVNAVLRRLSSDEKVIVVSDFELTSWQDELEAGCEVLLIDIQQVRFGRRRIRSAKEALHV